MPLPQRKPNESHDEFIERCMGDSVMVEEFPDAAQRRAVCERQARMRTQAHLNLVCDPGAITIEAAEEGQGDGRPKLPRFTMVAYTGVPMRVFGWMHPVVVDLAGLVIPSQIRPIRFGHDMQAGVGHTDAIRIEEGRLVAKGVVSRDTPAAREIVASARNGFPWQASIGAIVEEFEFVKENQKVLVNGREFVGPLTVIRKAILGEISFVDLGADGATSASVVAAGLQLSSKEENQAMKVTEKPSGNEGQQPPVAAGGGVGSNNQVPNPQPQASNEGQQPPVAAGGGVGPNNQVQNPQPQASDAQAAEAARILAIRQVCAGRHPDIEAQAIQEQWDVKRTALAVLRADRPNVRVTGNAANNWCDVVVSALAGRLGVDVPAQYAADAQRYARMPLSVLARRCCEYDGYDGVDVHGDSEEQVVRAAFSTRSFPYILSESARKVLLNAYQAVDRAAEKVARIVEVVDFKPHTLARLTGQFILEKLGPDGELKHATVADQGYTVKADTYGRIVGLTRQDVINDDLGAFLGMAQQLGRGAALALENAFWTMVEAANGTFFSAGNNNVITGASSAFGVAALNSAIAKLRKQKDAGNPIKARPRYVAVPPDLEADATQIYTSNVLLIAGQSDRTIGANNPHANKYEPVVSEYLPGNGASSVWYLVADPMDVPAFCVAFLQGQRGPTIEEAEPDPRYLGTQWRAYIDFGVALLDPRGAVRAAGS